MRRLFSRVGIRSTRQVDAFVNAERERRLNILHLSKDGDLFIFSLTHSLTHLQPLIRYLLVPFSGGGEEDSLGNFSPPPSPLSSFTPMSHQLIPTPLSPLSNSKLATKYMGYADRALTHSNIRPSGSSLMAFQQGIETFRSNCLYVLKLFQRVSWCKLYFSINRDLFGTRSLH